MAINPFRKSTIEKAKSSIFKGGVKEKRELARAAGSAGFSGRMIEERLRQTGYDPRKRRGIISQISGKKEKPGLSDEQKRRNILESRRTAVDAKTGYAASQVSFGGQKLETRSRVALDKSGAAPKIPQNRFGLGGNSSGFAGQRPDNSASAPPTHPGGRPALL